MMSAECPFNGDHFSPAARAACDACNPTGKGRHEEDKHHIKRLTPLPLYCACGRIEDGDEHACPVTHRRLKETLGRQRATIEFVSRQVRSISPDWDATIRWLDESIALDGNPAAGDQVDAYILFYADADVKPEHYSGAGAREAAWSRFRQASMSWSCHLFKRIAGTK